MSLVASFVALLFLFALFSGRLERTVVTAPMIFTAAGVALCEFVSGLLHQQAEAREIIRAVFLRAAGHQFIREKSRRAAARRAGKSRCRTEAGGLKQNAEPIKRNKMKINFSCAAGEPGPHETLAKQIRRRYKLKPLLPGLNEMFKT